MRHYVRQGRPIVEAAISHKRPHVVSALFEAGASDQTISDGDCPLLALALNESRTFFLILDRVKAKIAPQALVELVSIACRLPEGRALPIIERLLLAGAGPQLSDASGISPIQRACLDGQMPILELLLRGSALPMEAYSWIEKGALEKVDECESEFFASCYDQGPRRLHRWDPRTEVALRSYLDAIRIIRPRLVLPASSDLLMISILGSDIQLCRDLIAGGAEVDKPDRKGRLPLVESVGRAWGGEFRDLLLQKGADVNAVDDHGVSPLLAAVWVDEGMYRQEKDTILQLLKLGADPNLADCDGCIPMMKAAQQNRPELVKMLWEAGSFPHGVDVHGRGVLDFARTEQDRMFYHVMFASGRGGDGAETG